MAQRLISFIKCHGQSACISSNGRLDVLDTYCNRNGDWIEEWITIPATMSAVRNWLGY